MSRVWISYITRMKKSCHTYEWVKLHMWRSHITQINESYHTHDWVISHTWYDWVILHVWMSHITRTHIWISHITHMNESYHTYEWVIAHIQKSHITYTRIWMSHITHIWMSHITHMDESCHTCEWLAPQQSGNDITNYITHTHETYVTYASLFFEDAAPPKSSKSRNSNSSVQIQIEPKSQFEFVPRGNKEFEFLDLVDFGDVVLSVEFVIPASGSVSVHQHHVALFIRVRHVKYEQVMSYTFGPHIFTAI